MSFTDIHPLCRYPRNFSNLIASERKKDWRNGISEAERNSIEKGITDADNGNVNPHSKARDIYEKWL